MRRVGSFLCLIYIQAIGYRGDLLRFWSPTSLSGGFNFTFTGELNITSYTDISFRRSRGSQLSCKVCCLDSWVMLFLNREKDDIYRFCCHYCHNLYVRLNSLLLALDSFSQSPYLLRAPALDAYVEVFCRFLCRFNHRLISRKRLVAPGCDRTHIMITTYGTLLLLLQAITSTTMLGVYSISPSYNLCYTHLHNLSPWSQWVSKPTNHVLHWLTIYRCHFLPDISANFKWLLPTSRHGACASFYHLKFLKFSTDRVGRVSWTRCSDRHPDHYRFIMVTLKDSHRFQKVCQMYLLYAKIPPYMGHLSVPAWCFNESLCSQWLVAFWSVLYKLDISWCMSLIRKTCCFGRWSFQFPLVVRYVEPWSLIGHPCISSWPNFTFWQLVSSAYFTLKPPLLNPITSGNVSVRKRTPQGVANNHRATG